MPKPRKPEQEIFASNFKTLFENWQEEMKSEGSSGSQEHFAKLVFSNRRSVSEWMNAQSKPSKETMKRICDIFHTTEEELNNGTRAQNYRYSKNFTQEIHNKFMDYCEDLGLNHDFMKFVKTVIKDEEFPVWSPIYEPEENWLSPVLGEYERKPFYDAFESESTNEFQRKTKDGKTVNLGYADFGIMKEVQNEVSSFIEYSYFKVAKGMQEDLDSVNRDYVHSDTGEFIGVSNKKLWERDRYSKYQTDTFIKEVRNNGKHNKKK